MGFSNEKTMKAMPVRARIARFSSQVDICPPLESSIILATVLRGYFQIAEYSHNNKGIMLGMTAVLSLLSFVKIVRVHTRIGRTRLLAGAFLIALAVFFQIINAGHAVELAVACIVATALLDQNIYLIIKTMLYVTTAVMLTHAALLFLNAIPEGNVFNRNGELRQSYGFYHPSMIGMIGIQVVWLSQVLQKNESISSIVALGTGLMLYAVTGTRTLIALSILYSAIPIISKYILKNNFLLRKALLLMFPIIAMLNIIIAYYASTPDNIFNVLSGNHYLSAHAYLEQGFQLIGGQGFIDSDSSQYAWLQANFSSVPLDNYYVLVLTQWGLLMLVGMSVAWAIGCVDALKGKRFSLVIGLTMTLVYACVSATPLYSAWSIVPLFLVASWLKLVVRARSYFGHLSNEDESNDALGESIKNDRQISGRTSAMACLAVVISVILCWV